MADVRVQKPTPTQRRHSKRCIYEDKEKVAGITNITYYLISSRKEV
jgi:hypothetical protein